MSQERRLLVIELEPAPELHKYVLWNAFGLSDDFEVKLTFTSARDLKDDGSHKFNEFPSALFVISN